jgi:hypothetical protein
MGEFQFRVCSIDKDPSTDATQKCLDLNLLNVANNSTEYHVSPSAAIVQINVTLPDQLVCKHCVFQWKYITGNSWGVSSNGTACLGCGRENEEFYGCSDIAIVSEVESIVNPTTTPPPPTTTTTAITTTTAPRNCTSASTFSQSFDIGAIVEEYCGAICPSNCASDNVPGNEILYNGCRNTCNKLCVCG